MTDTVQEFKVGDKVKYKDDQCASINNHVQSKVYTVEKVEEWFGPESGQRVWFEDSAFVCWSGRLELSNQHIHHDLIVAWAKDPKGCVIQVKDSFNKWNDTLGNNPAWITFCEYRIKPKTEEVTRWKWVVKTIDATTYFVTDAEYTEDEAKKTFKHFTGIKIPDTAVTAIEEV